eukprot:EG_transcript_49240
MFAIGPLLRGISESADCSRGQETSFVDATSPSTIKTEIEHDTGVNLHQRISAGGFHMGSCATVLSPNAAIPTVGFLDMLHGDAAGLLNSISLCLFLTTTKQIRSQIPVLLFLTIQMAV